MVARMQRSIAATPEGLERLEKKRLMSGKTAEIIGELAGVSRSSAQKFFNGKPICVENFQALCKVLDLDWREIEGAQGEAPIGSRKRAVFVINGSLDKLDVTQLAKIQAMVQTLKNITGDASIVVVDIEEGSIRLILEGSEDGIKRLKQLFDGKELAGVLGTPVMDVKLNEFYLSKTEIVGKDRLKEQLVSLIKSQGAVGANLRDVDLSDADLQCANLSGADLRNANLFRANLSRVNLSDARLNRAFLSGANLSGADLRSANLREVNLSDARLNRADLIRADLRDSTNLSRSYLISRLVG
jgi:uncharacterized protein YjbI with pentapeptide repeats